MLVVFILNWIELLKYPFKYHMKFEIMYCRLEENKKKWRPDCNCYHKWNFFHLLNLYFMLMSVEMNFHNLNDYQSYLYCMERHYLFYVVNVENFRKIFGICSFWNSNTGILRRRVRSRHSGVGGESVVWRGVAHTTWNENICNWCFIIVIS